MNEETPSENPPLIGEELTVVARLSEADLQAIDATILGNCSDRWFKVARVVVLTGEALARRYPGLSYVYYARRVAELVDEGRLESQGYIFFMRHSEVRIPPNTARLCTTPN
ncbi:MAG TPA: DUF3658 domain-containing protein [Verrucomicrobiae bacterium]|jgi:hypothetical protein|nr:DUF3658 domain-containing protein [Verrucomicrobiae bacterium]